MAFYFSACLYFHNKHPNFLYSDPVVQYRATPPGATLIFDQPLLLLMGIVLYFLLHPFHVLTFVLSSTTRRPSADTHNTARTAFFPACQESTRGQPASKGQGSGQALWMMSLWTVPRYLFTRH